MLTTMFIRMQDLWARGQLERIADVCTILAAVSPTSELRGRELLALSEGEHGRTALWCPYVQGAVNDLVSNAVECIAPMIEANKLHPERIATIDSVLSRLKARFQEAVDSKTSINRLRIVEDDTESIFDVGVEYGAQRAMSFDQTEWSDSVHGGLVLIAADPSADELVRRFVTHVVPLQSQRQYVNLSFSSRLLRGVIFKSKEDTTWECGETLVHEADHQYYYCLEEAYQFWEDPDVANIAAYRSPWRQDLRPLDGILRGLCAFSRVVGYYGAVLHNNQVSDKERIGIRAAQRIMECAVAHKTLEESGVLSANGRALLEELHGRNRQVEEQLMRDHEYSKWVNRSDMST